MIALNVPPEELAIFRAFQGGETQWTLAEKHAVSDYKIRSVVKAVSQLLGEPVRPPLRHQKVPRPKTCRHCGSPCVSRPRGLCHGCYYTPGVRDQYPPLSTCGRRSEVGGNRATKLPKPTTALPKTEEYFLVLEERARLGLALHNPLDARRDLS